VSCSMFMSVSKDGHEWKREQADYFAAWPVDAVDGDAIGMGRGVKHADGVMELATERVIVPVLHRTDSPVLNVGRCHAYTVDQSPCHGL
jgi:hypothetical protein